VPCELCKHVALPRGSPSSRHHAGYVSSLPVWFDKRSSKQQLAHSDRKIQRIYKHKNNSNRQSRQNATRTLYLTCLFSAYRQSIACSEVIYVRPILSTQSSSTNIAARRFSCCASTVWNSLPSFVRTADSFTLSVSACYTYMFARHLQTGRRPLSAPLIPLPGLSRVINSLLTYLLTSIHTHTLVNNREQHSLLKIFLIISLSIEPGYKVM